MKIAVIGAGPSGMTAALQAAWGGAEVTLFERNLIVGRKLLATGSGHCNLTNAGVAGEKYACADPAWLNTLFGRFGVSHLLALLEEIGVPSYHTSDGWYYPLSNSAQTVADAFFTALQLAKVRLHTATQVTSIRRAAPWYSLRFVHEGREQEQSFERVILSAGGKAYPTLGSKGELFPVLEQLGHTVLPKRPALAPLLVDLGELDPLQGVRLDVGASLWEGKTCLGRAAGNLIFTQWGLNGPAVMDLSHLVSDRPGAHLALSLDLLAFVQPDFDRLLANKRASRLPLKGLLGAFFPPKVTALYARLLRLAEDTPLGDIDQPKLEQLVDKLHATRLAVRGVRDFEYCQVSAGGVPVSEVDPLTLESRRLKGLYLTGETLDVVGPCGGYNLQYAFSSGAAAGMAAAQLD